MLQYAMRRLDVGQRFGRWTVLEYAGLKNAHEAWRCQCDCGTIRITQGRYLLNGLSQSCGCRQSEIAKNNFTTHGRGYDDPTYRTWHGMMARCYNTKSRNYKWYGGRGIKVCERWHSFENFLADIGEKPPGLTFDRINVNGDYEPTNWRWATWHEQQKNKRAQGNRYRQLEA